MPFQRTLETIVDSMVAGSLFWLNARGVSRTLGASELITGQPVVIYKHYPLSFGTRTQVAQNHDNRIQIPRTSGAIALHYTGNAQDLFQSQTYSSRN
jgi:hypothetical protein